MNTNAVIAAILSATNFFVYLSTNPVQKYTIHDTNNVAVGAVFHNYYRTNLIVTLTFTNKNPLIGYGSIDGPCFETNVLPIYHTPAIEIPPPLTDAPRRYSDHGFTNLNFNNLR